MTTRGVIGDVHFLDDSAAEGEPVLFRLERVGFAEDAIFMPSDVDTVVQADGTIERVELWASAEGGRNLLCILPNGYTWKFSLEPGVTDITLQELHALNAPLEPEVSPTIQSLTTGLITAERERYASILPNLGPSLIGYQAEGVGAVPQTVQVKLDETRTVAGYGADHTGVTETRAALQSALSAAAADPTIRRIEVAAGEYLNDSKVDDGLDSYSLILDDVHGLHLVGHPGAKFLVDDGTHGRFLIIRNCTNIIIEGIQFIDISDRTAGVAINSENSSGVTIRDCIIDGFGSYGIGITEATNAPGAVSSLISFSGNTITGTAGMFSAFVVPCELLVLNSTLNNGRLHATAVAGDGSSVTVTETLVTEAAGTSFDILVNNTFTMTGNTLSVETADLDFLNENSFFTLSGASVPANNATFEVDSIDTFEGLSLNITGTFADEGPGASITLTRLGRPSVRVLDATACDDILIEHCTIRNSGRIGIEDFPKALSRNHSFLYNTIEYCGHFITSGSAMKPGQGTVNTLVQGNVIRGCQMGISPGCTGTIKLVDNHILNCHKYGIALTMSRHVLGLAVDFSLLEITGNTITFTTDELTGELFETPTPGYAAINFNGLLEEIGALDIADNTIMKWGSTAGGYGTNGINIKKSFVPYPNIKIRNNQIIDSGGIKTIYLAYTCTMVNGSDTLTNFVNVTTGRSGTGGIYKDMQLVHPNIPTDGRVASVNHAAGTAKLTLPATASLVATPVRSAFPYGMLVEGNTFEATTNAATSVIQMYSDAGVFRNNIVRGFAAYALQVVGSTFMVDGNRFKENNQTAIASRGPILLGTPADPLGVYTVINNQVDLGLTGFAAFMVNATNVASWYNFNNIALSSAVLPYLSSSVTPLDAFWWQGNKRFTLGLAPPTSGQNGGGYEIVNLAPTVFIPIRSWLCVASGNPGTWVAVGGVGRGTTAQRPALTVGSAGFLYRDTTTSQLLLWSGSAWEVV